MKIKTIISEHRNDFSAIMQCEHCGHEHKITSGYHDNNYHTNVIPAMKCQSCGKQRDGTVAEGQALDLFWEGHNDDNYEKEHCTCDLAERAVFDLKDQS